MSLNDFEIEWVGNDTFAKDDTLSYSKLMVDLQSDCFSSRLMADSAFADFQSHVDL